MKLKRTTSKRGITSAADLPKGVPFVMQCSECDMDAPPSWESAVLAGWTEIEADLNGMTWNFLGMCPECRDEQ
jgi:hypothetical protein